MREGEASSRPRRTRRRNARVEHEDARRCAATSDSKGRRRKEEWIFTNPTCKLRAENGKRWCATGGRRETKNDTKRSRSSPNVHEGEGFQVDRHRDGVLCSGFDDAWDGVGGYGCPDGEAASLRVAAHPCSELRLDDRADSDDVVSQHRWHEMAVEPRVYSNRTNPRAHKENHPACWRRGHIAHCLGGTPQFSQRDPAGTARDLELAPNEGMST